jgi:uncharacterized protein YbjT (DUF2867 family)
MNNDEPKVALLAGASGLVGGYALDSLLDAPDFARVFAISRRPLGREHPRLANRIVQFDRLEAQLKGTVCHVAFCCLGTTRKKAGGSEEAFREVDYDLTLAFARAARAAGAQRLVVVSSVGADPASKYMYLRVKGEVEQALEQVGFPSLDILQPGALYGWRGELRPLELLTMAAMPLVNPFLTGSKMSYRGISARTVAEGMIGAARSNRRGTYRYTWQGIQQLAAIKPVRTVPLTPKQQSGAR